MTSRVRTAPSTSHSSVARSHAVKAADALEGADDLDARVCEELGSLVDGLVTRES